MVKKKPTTSSEEHLLLPKPPSVLPIVDTHTHLAPTFEFYRASYQEGKQLDVYSFVTAMYEGRNVDAIVDVWCDAPVKKLWKEFADAAMNKERWGGTEYWFALGVHPHDAKNYDDDVEKDILEAMAHPRCVGWGEIGLDYHSDNSPREIQQAIFSRQLKQAIKLGKPLVIHTREADDDTERILKTEVPEDYKIHVHCFSDSPEFAKRLLDHFPNLYIGITGIITYATNKNTSAVICDMITPSDSSFDATTLSPTSLRILLETDAPFMVPGNLYDDLPTIGRKKLPISHSAMVPWTAKFVADIANRVRIPTPPVPDPIVEPVEPISVDDDGIEMTETVPPPLEVELWDADVVMTVARENAHKVYGV